MARSSTDESKGLGMKMSRNKTLNFVWLVIGVAAIVMLVFAYYASTWPGIASAKAALDTCDETFCDFQYFYYPMGTAIFSTHQPVEGFVYSPFIAILASVFPPLGLQASIILWGVLQALSIVLYLLLFFRLVPARLPVQLLFTLLLLTSFPLLHILTWGQVGLFTVTAVLAAQFFYQRGNLWVAAGLLAFAISFKFFPLIFLVLFVFQRNLRFLWMVAAACGLCLFVIPGILLGVDGMLRYYSALLDSYRHFDWVITNYNSQFSPHVMLRMGQALNFDGSVPLPVLRGISYLIATLNLGFVFVVRRSSLPHADLWSLHILFLTVPFLLQTSWPADLVYLPFGQALMLWQLLGRGVISPVDPLARRRFPARKAAGWTLLASSIVLSNMFFFNFIGNRVHFGSAGFIFWANLLLLAATYVEVIPAALRAKPALIV